MAERLCPMCRAVTVSDRGDCYQCDYVFGQPPNKVRELLRERLAANKVVMWVVLGCDLLALPMVAFVAWYLSMKLAVIGLAALIVITGITIRNTLTTRASLRSIDRQFPEVPKATALSK